MCCRSAVTFGRFARVPDGGTGPGSAGTVLIRKPRRAIPAMATPSPASTGQCAADLERGLQPARGRGPGRRARPGRRQQPASGSGASSSTTISTRPASAAAGSAAACRAARATRTIPPGSTIGMSRSQVLSRYRNQPYNVREFANKITPYHRRLEGLRLGRGQARCPQGAGRAHLRLSAKAPHSLRHSGDPFFGATRRLRATPAPTRTWRSFRCRRSLPASTTASSTNSVATRPRLTADELFEGARARVEAIVQAITYKEYLPSLLGEDAICRLLRVQVRRRSVGLARILGRRLPLRPFDAVADHRSG